ncbi:MAG: PHP domain-containing protein [Thermodesulfobacteriota bacterium]|nr:PHP domain-containing protein [Thermodesulfobacteriota bacterium]
MYIDLHVHTTFSDGSFTPEEVVIYAKSKDLAGIAITDHDTIDGNMEALNTGKKEGIEVVQGVEISVEHKGGTMHILGYFIDLTDKGLITFLEKLQNGRQERNFQILKQLNNLGIEITYEEVLERSCGAQLGRPHFASIMVEKGYVESHKDAFNRYLKKGGPAYAERARYYPKDAINVLREAGGIPVLAHPFTLNTRTQQELRAVVKKLAHFGLMGIEVYSPDHTTKQTENYLRVAEQFGLVVTGGTDFHGANKENVDLGSLMVPYRYLEMLKALKTVK